MTLTEDIKTVNTHGFILNDGGTWIDVKAKNVIIYITKRPVYCDRGRYGVLVTGKPNTEHILTIDEADGFPRYFFNLQRLFDELKDWVDFNETLINK